ncbi:MAG: EamA family transporter [Candidatus Buchananbacteria bacterium]|nr:EamA family transporter [Candidatus Buchananbacteria bacterium]
MTWFTIAIIAYFLNAIAVTIDKFLLSKKISNPAVYAIFISTLSLLSLVLMPFGFKLYSASQILIALLAGLIFTFALFYMFKALSQNEASRITPFMGGLQPIFVFILALFFLNENLGLQQIVAFVIIIIGTVAISWQGSSKTDKKTAYLFAAIATLLFAISYTINKYSFINQDFISGFIWTRVGAFIGALVLLASAKNRCDIMLELRKPKKQAGGLFLIGQLAGALSFILINYAIAISSSVALVNALQGLQYVFLLAIVFSLSSKFPRLLEEKFTTAIVIKKIIATLLIIVGLFILFV